MKNILFLVLFGIGLIYTPVIQGQVFDKNNLEAKIDSLIPPAVNDTTPGLVLGIVQNGELIFSKGYGLANISYGLMNDPKMVYNIGSVSKQFLGYAFAMLHVEGHLDIDDLVNKYFDDWPEFEHKVTLRHLLTHTSGYREAYTMSNLAGRIIGVDRLSKEECLNVVRKQPQLEYIPGSRYTYNSTAWVILAVILEKVTGQPADEWVEINILQPLEMNDTQIESHVGEVILNTAESYVYDDEQGYINLESNRAIFGAADVCSSVQDLAKWTNNFRSLEVGGKEVLDLFLDPFILNDGTNTEYALGISNSSYRGLKRYRHTGGHEAFATQLSYFPDHDLGIITISNYGGTGWLTTSKIADLLLEEHMTSSVESEYQQYEIEKEKLEQFAGLYLASTLNRTINLSMSRDTLTYEGRTRLIPTSENTFHVEGWNAKFIIENLSNGQTQLTEVYGPKETYTKVKKWTPMEDELTAFEGDYWSKELETVYHLSVKDKILTVQHRWLGELALEPITNDLFKMDGSFIQFFRDQNEEISGLSINSGRTLNVHFHRKE